MGRLTRLWAVLVVVGLCFTPAAAQFGKNKIAYDTFDWEVYRSPHFDIHYYGTMEESLPEIVSYVESAYVKISKDLDHELRYRIPLILYQTHADFEQTNIVLQELPEAVGAFAEPVQNRMVVPIDLPPDQLYALLAHELVHIFQYSMFFEGNLGRALRSNPPTWLMEGMASYLADDENNIDRMAIRDAVVNNILPPIQALNVLSFLTYRYGHAIFDYIEQEHGIEGVRTFIFEFRRVLLTNNIGKAVEEAFGYDIDEFNRRFNRFLRRRYFPVLLEKKSPDDYGTEIGVRGVYTFSPAISPSGELIAALSAPRQEIDLVVLSGDDGAQVKNLTKGWTNKYQNLVSESFDGKRDLSWSPVDDLVAVFARKEGRRRLLVFNALSGKMVHNLELPNIAQTASPAFSPDGSRVAFEGNLEGVVDIFEIHLETGDIRNLTQDVFYDSNPAYSSDGNSLLYNRRIGPHWKIFSVDYNDSSRKRQLTFGPSSDLQPAYSSDESQIYFSSDRNDYGVFNIYSLDIGTGQVRQYTDVVGGCFAPVELAERDDTRFIAFAAYNRGQFRLYRMALAEPEAVIEPEERLANPIEVQPFEPPMRLTVDENQKEDYKVRWDINVPDIALGVADDGTFLSNAAVEFTDLLGDQRIQIVGQSVSSFSNISAQYINLKGRVNWGGGIFDQRDFFVRTTVGGFTGDQDQVQRTTGAQAFVQYPFNRHVRVDSSLSYWDLSQDVLVFGGGTATINEKFGLFDASLTVDTTRFQSFGPFQGKRFRLGVQYGANLGGDTDGDIQQYSFDYRGYRQATRRSVLAWRLVTLWNEGDREIFYPLGGINQLRGYDFRDFFGSRVAWTNVEFRFPLIDQLRFPILAIQQIRGVFFVDVGAAWFGDDTWFDPQSGIRLNPLTGEPIPFEFWDSENDRLQDGRASYGAGLNFRFLGGLQFNWVWSKRLDHTAIVCVPNDAILGCAISGGAIEKVEVDGGDTRMDFFIQFDW
ncbi:hypothetical protein ABI59_12710 [Acidobacteria bacterium Mor1]|nr:hypothetical protein ABI59_12710 [Acidobacteria bacterium Mor1]